MMLLPLGGWEPCTWTEASEGQSLGDGFINMGTGTHIIHPGLNSEAGKRRGQGFSMKLEDLQDE